MPDISQVPFQRKWTSPNEVVWYKTGKNRETYAGPRLQFQNGSPIVYGINGLTNEQVLEAVRERIENQNKLEWASENVSALADLERALASLRAREIRKTIERERKGV